MKKLCKTAVCALLTLALLCALCVLPASAAGSPLQYKVTEYGYAMVTGCDPSASGTVKIPAKVTMDGKSCDVKFVGEKAFANCTGISEIVIPEGVTAIGEHTFLRCGSLSAVTLPDTLTSIGEGAFNYFNALDTVKCLGTVPPVMASADCFSTAAYNRATLLVPRNSESTYSAADYWYKFAHIDGDGEVSIRDVTRMIDAILTGDNEGVYFESADLNSNGRLDIGDVTSLIDNLLNGDY